MDKGVDVIVVIAGGENLIFEKIGVPIINLDIKTADIFRALFMSKKYSKTAILTIDNKKINSEYKLFKEHLDIDFEEEFFNSESEVKDSILKYLDRKNEIVIVGESNVCIFAEKYGMDSIAVEISENSIKDTVNVILDMAKLQGTRSTTGIEQSKDGLNSRYTFNDFKYRDTVTKNFISEAKIVGQTDYTILLYGESGSGKEIIAHSIHNISKRSSNNFVPINCSAISESLLESELFGYEEGAFTGAKKGGKRGLFELANNGTLFLDEINTLPLSIQTKLLRVIEERQIMRIGSDHITPLNIRIIAATNEPLIDKIEKGDFRADLFYRLSSLELNIPPLRERKEDIVLLFNNFAFETMKENNMDNLEKQDVIKLSDKYIKLLKDYNWPGNVRELKNIARKYVITGKIDIGKFKNSSLYVVKNTDDSKSGKLTYNIGEINNLNLDIKEIQKSVEVKIIDMMLDQGLSKNDVARILGISRTSLWKKYNQHV